ncbi:MAG: energy transducer TonB [Fibrobacteria bacterium]|nr:energy transducer TonB [Fibrobacteria bacterium]
MIIKRIILAFFALLLSGGLIISIPVLNFIIHGGFGEKKEPTIVAEVSIKKVALKKQLKPPRKKLRRPVRNRPSRTRLQTGPRFAMDLSVTGIEGVGVEMELVNRARGQGEEEGDVDERPNPDFPPPFRLPAEIRDEETDAYTLLSFCVDERGKAFDIHVMEERPAGMGMAQAGKDALRQTKFSPAQKAGKPVAFCGLEQPFEVKFDD